MSEFQIQESQYDFPYHHIPHFGKRGEPQLCRVLTWGWDYLTYMGYVVELVSTIRPQSLLDVGCGDGRLIGMIGDSATRKIGIDLSGRAISLAKAMVPQGEFLVKNVEEVEETFDCVTLVEVLEHIPDERVERFFAQVAKRVRPGGVLIVSVPTTVVERNKKHYRHYDKALLMEHLGIEKNGLSIDREVYLYRETALLRTLQKLFVNRSWVVTSRGLLRLFWSLQKRRYAIADKTDGRHLLLTLRKHL